MGHLVKQLQRAQEHLKKQIERPNAVMEKEFKVKEKLLLMKDIRKPKLFSENSQLAYYMTVEALVYHI